jgi:hypothetical protein
VSEPPIEKQYHAQKQTKDGQWAMVNLDQMQSEMIHFRACVKYNDKRAENWNISKFGTAAAIGEWLERMIPLSPDPELLNEVLAELNTQIPDGLL